ncbi:aminotransferase class III-fold pyridoxal phosphate-dependent enzyme [Vibrio hannami]|uniref:aminotransferase class III-fold pyridoxal phosphate-dependent enzyme n=1 Tax=Vibrio hannami TaxID=2717094 RepID=UPI00240F5BA4|nr:aminotransferase class III-fold pyridoxal phosphate-dependent enzyme [Vibrio hannami]MDG3085260.1 aminotransferase class III-fold pyridoxal phosphate-dependent enzyme [Vibrio hannami]
MTHSTKTVEYTTDELIQLAHKSLTYWGLGEFTEVTLIKHRENAVFKIQSSHGDYAMRIHRFGYHTDQELRSELDWIQAIPSGELFTADVLPTQNGELFLSLALDDDKQALQIDLLEWANGVPIATIENGFDDIAHVESTYYKVGRLMAMSHIHSREWDLPENFSRHNWDEKGIFGPGSLWGDYHELAQLNAEQIALIDKAIVYARKDLAEFGKNEERYGLIHADFLPENLLQTEEGICLIDFDDAGFGWLLFDIATAVFPYLGEEHFDQTLEALIQGYSEILPLKAEDLEKLPLFLFIRSVTYLGWMHTRKESTTAQELTDIVVEGATALAEQYLSIVEAPATNEQTGSMLGSATTDLNSLQIEDDSLAALINERKSTVGGSMLFYKEPLAVSRAKGSYVYDQHQRPYLDCYNNVQSVGHANPEVREAVYSQMGELNTHTRYLEPKLADYAKQLTATMPEGLDVVFFTNSGTEANDLAYRIASSLSQQTGAIVMDAAYHGNSYLVNQLSTAVNQITGAPLAPQVTTLPLPTESNQIESDLDSAFELLESKNHKIAAFMCDAIFDSYGGHLAPKEFFERVYKRVRAFGGYTIADEVQAGFGRTGKMWGFEHYDVVPDMVTLGKPMGNGFPIGAVVTSKEIAEKFMKSTVYFNTFGGNAVACSAAKAVLTQIEQKSLVAHAAEMDEYLHTGLTELAKRFCHITNIRGRGLYYGFDLVIDGQPAFELAKLIPDALKSHGVLIGLTGKTGTTVKVRPPLVITKSQIDDLLVVFEKVFDDLLGQLKAA